MLEVRPATPDDVRGIVAVHTAGEDLSGLSVRERYLKHLPGRPGKASLFLWGSSKDVESALGRAKELGLEKVLTTLDEETAERLGAEKKGRVQIIGKGL